MVCQFTLHLQYVTDNQSKMVSSACYLSSLAFNTMFIWAVAPCGLLLVPMAGRSFSLILLQAPPLDLNTVYSNK